jgi:uncharacterized lipoprotein YbaY
MKKVSGQITVNGNRKPFKPETKATVQVIDCSLPGRPAITLGKQVLRNLKEFPLNFQVEYDESPIIKILRGQYALQISIETGETLVNVNVNDTRFSVVDYKTLQILENINAFVIPVIPFSD